MIIGRIRHGRPTVMRRLLIRSKRRVLIASDYLERALAHGRDRRPVERPHDKVDRAQPIAIARARSFHVARWSLETGTSVPVAPVWTRATGRELVAIDRARFGKVSCGHGHREVSLPPRHFGFRTSGAPSRGGGGLLRTFTIDGESVYRVSECFVVDT